MKEAVKIFANKTKKSNALDLEYQNRKKNKKKNKGLIQVISQTKLILKMMEREIIQ